MNGTLTTPPTPATSPGGYVAPLDGIRAIAIAGVFALHLDSQHFPGGAFGVDVFFVLSAFLITGNLLRERITSGRVNFSAFYWRRAFRLGPALVAWLVVFAIPAAYASGVGRKVPWSSIGSIFYINDFLEAWTHLVAAPFDQTWSLAVEEQFYIVWPAILVFVILRLRAKQRDLAFAGLVVAAVVLSFFTGNYFLPTGHLMALTLGCWAANQMDGERGPAPWVRSIARRPELSILSLGVFVIVTLHTFPGHEGFAAALVVDLAATVLILAVAGVSASAVGRILGSAVPRWIGARSYGIYLYGLTALALVPAVTHLRRTYATPVDLAVTFVAVWASYRFFESPVRSWGRRWLRTRAGQERPAGRPLAGERLSSAPPPLATEVRQAD